MRAAATAAAAGRNAASEEGWLHGDFLFTSNAYSDPARLKRLGDALYPQGYHDSLLT